MTEEREGKPHGIGWYAAWGCATTIVLIAVLAAVGLKQLSAKLENCEVCGNPATLHVTEAGGFVFPKYRAFCEKHGNEYLAKP